MRMPLLFVSHGAPTVALDGGAFGDALRSFGRALGAPDAIVAVSAHWETPVVAVATADRMETIHDFAGFPDALFQMTWPAPGAPELARDVLDLLEGAGLRPVADGTRGLDHGAWIPLSMVFPEPVPTIQVSLPRKRKPALLLEMGRALRPLRRRRVLIVGTGGIVHNLGLLRFDDRDAPVAPWAAAFDSWVASRLAARDVTALLAYRDLAPHAAAAVPTPEHFDPLLFVLGAVEADDEARTLHEGFTYGSLSMRCISFQPA